VSPGRTAVVTGGASGIGAGIVARLVRDGYQVAALDRQPVTADSGGADPGTECLSVIADVTDRAAVDAALAQVRDRYGPVTILVNGAGLDGHRKFRNITFEQWSRVLDVNLNGVFHLTQAVLPDMLEAGWGRIVNISSSSTHGGQPYMAHYVAAKSAVNGLTKSLALEYGPNGITVNAVPPGFVDTPMLRKSEERGLLGSTIEEIAQRTPVRRPGVPADIAATVSFLVSEEASYITGQIIGVNGGRNT
jgi:2-hydroxycyclohexanecarboxyl-CoA dehydrogenase